MCRLAIIALSAAVYLLSRRVADLHTGIGETNAALADHVRQTNQVMRSNANLVRIVNRMLVPVRNTPDERARRSAQC